MPVSSSILSTVSARYGRESCLAERFTDITRCGMRGCSSCHSLALKQASLKTCSPIGITSPLSSAMGTNSEGSKSPRSGCSHLTKASTAQTSPLWRLTIG
jgi:hypothetical protein